MLGDEPSVDHPPTTTDRSESNIPNAIAGSTLRPVESGKSRAARIAEAAYRLAQARGFEPGAELEDWLAAEREIDAQDGDAESK